MPFGLPVGGTDQSELVTVVVDNQPLGAFDTWSGGDAVAKDVKHRAAGMGPEIPFMALASYTPITVGRVYQADRDHELVRTLITKAGRKAASITIQPLDSDGNAYGQPRTASGFFLGVKNLKGDSQSDAIQLYELEMSVVAWA